MSDIISLSNKHLAMRYSNQFQENKDRCREKIALSIIGKKASSYSITKVHALVSGISCKQAFNVHKKYKINIQSNCNVNTLAQTTLTNQSDLLFDSSDPQTCLPF